MIIPRCKVDVITLADSVRCVRLRNPLMDVLVLPDKGADIYAIIDRASGIDLLWKNAHGLRAPNTGRLSPDSEVAWMEQYEGGWQEILPNGGNPCMYKGLELSFHGESTMLPWRFEVLRDDGAVVEVLFSAQLYRSPFRIERRMRLDADAACLRLAEKVINQASEPMEFMWGHHPAFGAPLVSEHARLLCNARTLIADADYDAPGNVLCPGATYAWPYVDGQSGRIDMQIVPGRNEPRGVYAYLSDFDGPPWFAIINPVIGLGAGMAWSHATYPYCWLWQEMHSGSGYPFYSRTYTMAVEPWSSIPGYGLQRVINETGSQLSLGAGESLNSQLSVVLFTIDPAHTVERINPDGSVVLQTS